MSCSYTCSLLVNFPSCCEGKLQQFCGFWGFEKPDLTHYQKSLSSFLHKAQPTHLELQHQVHSLFPKWVDVIKDQSDDDINTIRLMGGNAILNEQENRTCKREARGDLVLDFTRGIVARLPDFHGRGPGSTLWGSPESGWWGPHSSHWCRVPAGRGPRWCCHRYSLRTAESRTQDCSCSCCSDSEGSSEKIKRSGSCECDKSVWSELDISYDWSTQEKMRWARPKPYMRSVWSEPDPNLMFHKLRSFSLFMKVSQETKSKSSNYQIIISCLIKKCTIATFPYQVKHLQASL